MTVIISLFWQLRRWMRLQRRHIMSVYCKTGSDLRLGKTFSLSSFTLKSLSNMLIVYSTMIVIIYSCCWRYSIESRSRSFSTFAGAFAKLDRSCSLSSPSLHSMIIYYWEQIDTCIISGVISDGISGLISCVISESSSWAICSGIYGFITCYGFWTNSESYSWPSSK